MTMHGYIIRLIVNTDGIPLNYYPILKINDFSTFPVGFHTIGALVSIASEMPAYRSALFCSCLVYFLFSMFLFIFLKNYCGRFSAALSVLFFSFFIKNPQMFFEWGGTPTILAFVLFIYFIYQIQFYSETPNVYFASLSLAAIFLTHTIIFIQSVYIFGITYLFCFFFLRKSTAYNLKKNALISICFFIFLIPYLLNINYNIAETASVELLKDWIRNQRHSWKGDYKNFIFSVPLYIFENLNADSIFNIYFACCLFGFFLLMKKNFAESIKYLIFLIVIILLIVNTRYWFLPLSYLIYPERTAVMAAVSLCIFFAIFLEYFFKCLKIFVNEKINIFLRATTLIIIICLIFHYNNIYYLLPAKRFDFLRSNDLEAFKWLEKNTKQDDVIASDYSAPAYWIPAVIMRPVTRCHINGMYELKIEQNVNPKYIYLTEKSDTEIIRMNIDIKKTLYNKNNVRIISLTQKLR